jgi:hypothetical protein
MGDGTDPRRASLVRSAWVLLGLGIAVLLLWGALRQAQNGAVFHRTALSRHRGERAGGERTDLGDATRTDARMRGIVVDRKASPIASAYVCVICRSGGCRPDGDPACSRTDVRGTFMVQDLVPGTYILSASAKGYLPADYDSGARSPTRGDVSLKSGEERDGIRVTLEAGGALLTGRVFDATGGPIAGARVVAAPTPNGGALSAGETGADGQFELQVAPGTGLLTAQAPGYARTRRGFVAPSQDVNLVLTPASSLAGRVVEESTGRPVPGVTVTANKDFGGMMMAFRSTEADAQGEFLLDALPTGSFELTARGASWSTRSAVAAELGVAEAVSSIVLTVSRAAVVGGRVLRAGQPCEPGQGWVRLVGAQATSQDTGRDGRVRLVGVLPGAYTLTAFCNGARRVVEQLTLAAGDALEKEWLVDSGLAVSGTVRSADSRPGQGIRVDVNPVTAGPEVRGTSCVSDSAGRFTCSGLTPGGYDCVASGEHGPLSEKVSVTLQQTNREGIQLRLSPVGELKIRVVDESGAPLDDVPVFAEDSARRRYTGRRLGNGETIVSELAPGRYNVQAGLAERAVGQRRSADILPGALVTVNLEHSKSTAELGGRVTDEHGAGVPDVHVSLTPHGQTPSFESYVPPALTDATGAFRIAGINPGSYGLKASHPALGNVALPDVRTSTSVDIVMALPGTISGIVKSSRGTPVKGFRLFYSTAGDSAARTFTNQEGTWTLGKLRPGNWMLRVQGQSSSATHQLTLAPGQHVRDIQITLDEP